MPVDLQQLQDIHRLENEVDQARAGVKQLVQNRVDLVEACPNTRYSRKPGAAVEAAKAKLKIALRENRDLARLDGRNRRGAIRSARLREILSHTLVLYTQQTGKVVTKEHDLTQQIELRARISERLLGQERLPIGINRHLGQHFPIPVGMKVEGKRRKGSDGT